MSIFDWFRKGRRQEFTTQTTSNVVTIESYWLGEIWRREPVAIPASVDIAQFFNRTPLPPLFGDSGYERNYQDDKQRAFHWIAAFLSHPDGSVVLDTFRYWEGNWRHYTDSEVNMNYRTVMFIAAAPHLLSVNPALVKAAAEFIWRGYSQSNFKGLFRIAIYDLGDREGTLAAERLVQYCPQEHRRAFDSMCQEFFANPSEF